MAEQMTQGSSSLTPLINTPAFKGAFHHCGINSSAVLMKTAALGPDAHALPRSPASSLWVFAGCLAATQGLQILSDRDIHFCLCTTIRTLLRSKKQNKTHTHTIFPFFHLFSVYPHIAPALCLLQLYIASGPNVLAEDTKSPLQTLAGPQGGVCASWASVRDFQNIHKGVGCLGKKPQEHRRLPMLA